MKVRLIVLALLAALALPAAGSAHASRTAPVIHEIDHLRWETNRLRQQAGRKPLKTSFLYRTSPDPGYRLWVRAIWREHLRTARRLAHVPAVWKRLAVCETGGNWRHVNSTYQGGLGFYHGSWDAYRPRGFPRDAHLATPAQQVIVAKRILADVGWSAWPACSLRLGLR